MKKLFSIILTVCMVASLAGCFSNKPRATVVTNSGEIKQMTLKEIKDIEETNRILFDDEYIGADITVTATVKEIGGSYALSSWFSCDAYVKLDAGNVGSFFKPITREYAATLNVGDTITVSGKIAMASVSGFNVYIFEDENSPY